MKLNFVLPILLSAAAAAASNCSLLGISALQIFNGSSLDSYIYGGTNKNLYFEATAPFSLVLVQAPSDLSDQYSLNLFLSPAEENRDPDVGSYGFKTETSFASPVGIIRVNSSTDGLACFAVKIREMKPNRSLFSVFAFSLKILDLNQTTWTTAAPTLAPPTSAPTASPTFAPTLPPTSAPTPQCVKYPSIQPGQLINTWLNQSGSIDRGDFKYYYFNAPARTVVTITLTSTYQDADLYVSFASKTLKPTSSLNDQSSTSSGRIDAVSLNSYVDSCISIGIYGYGSSYSSYQLSVQTSPLVSKCIANYPSLANSSNTLDYRLLSKQFSGQVQPGLLQYFFLSVEASLPVTLTLQNVYGDSDLYVSYAFRYTRPDRSHYDFYSIRVGSTSENINLDSTVSTGPTCYAVGVYGAGAYNSFILSVTSNAPTTAAPTYRPTTTSAPSPTGSYYSKCGRLGLVSNSYESYIYDSSTVSYLGYKYYYFSASSSSDVTISLSTSFGNADLYVSNAATTTNPTKSVYSWYSSNTYYTDSVTVSTYSDEMCIAIGIYGADYSTSSTFSLTVTTTPRYSYTSAPTSGGDDHLGLYIFLGIFIPLLVCVVIPVTMVCLCTRRPPPQAVPGYRPPPPAAAAVRRVEAAPLLHDPEFPGEGERVSEAGGTFDSIPPPAYN